MLVVLRPVGAGADELKWCGFLLFFSFFILTRVLLEAGKVGSSFLHIAKSKTVGEGGKAMC